jgi:hypothetical protein
MKPVAMECTACQARIEGQFRQTLFERLPPEDLATLEQFLLSDFNMRTMGERTGLGYTALRTRIDRLLAAYRALIAPAGQADWLLDRVERGEITADEAAALLRERKGGGKR